MKKSDKDSLKRCPADHTKRKNNESFKVRSNTVREYMDRIFVSIYTETFKKRTREVVIALLIISFLTLRSLQMLGLLLGLIVIAALSKLTQEPIPFVVGFDLCLFVTIVVGYAIHPAVGFIVGGVSSFFGSLLRSRQEADTMLVPIAGYFWTSMIIAFTRNHMSFFMVGVMATLFYALHNAIIFAKIRHFSIHTITFLSTSIPFNIILIKKLAPALITLLA